MTSRTKKSDDAKFDVSSGGSITVNTDAVVNSPSFKRQLLRARRLVKDGTIEFDLDNYKKASNG